MMYANASYSEVFKNEEELTQQKGPLPLKKCQTTADLRLPKGQSTGGSFGTQDGKGNKQSSISSMKPIKATLKEKKETKPVLTLKKPMKPHEKTEVQAKKLPGQIENQKSPLKKPNGSSKPNESTKQEGLAKKGSGKSPEKAKLIIPKHKETKTNAQIEGENALLVEFARLQKNFEYSLALLKNLRNFWVLRSEELKEKRMDLEERLQVKKEESDNLSICISNNEYLLQASLESKGKDSQLKKSFQGTQGMPQIGGMVKKSSFMRRSNSSVFSASQNQDETDGFQNKKSSKESGGRTGSFLKSFLPF